MADYDVVVLGAGPGGYVAAIRAAQLGKRVGIIESRYWGGVCLNVGCIPTKSLIRNAELVRLLSADAAKYGIAGEFTFDYGAAFSRSRSVAERMSKGVHFLMKKNGIEELVGWGVFTDAHSIDVRGADGDVRHVTFDSCIIATGATAKHLVGTSISDRVVDYEGLILSDHLPSSIVIAGSGAIGIEFGYVLAAYGVAVTIVEYLDTIAPSEDVEVSAELARAFRGYGITMLTSTRVEDVSETDEGVTVTIAPVGGKATESGGAAEGVSNIRELKADMLLQAVGFAPRLEGYGLENTGVTTSNGAIEIDEYMATNVSGIYAIGDVTGKLMLAHTAEAQAIVAAESLAGESTRPIDYRMIPKAMYCNPQVASFGYTQAAAEAAGFTVKTSKFPFSANGKAQGLGEPTGFVKIIADAATDEILGAHMIGADVTELLPELTLAQLYSLRAQEVAANIHAHPTLSEAIKEAAEGIGGHFINL
jgi:dihydrolipoamide dehydrogenase